MERSLTPVEIGVSRSDEKDFLGIWLLSVHEAGSGEVFSLPVVHSPDHAADFVSRLRGFVDAAPHVIRYHRVTQCFLDTAERLADKKDATPQSLGYSLLEIFTEQPQLAAILEQDPKFDPTGFWAYDSTENITGLITSGGKDKSFVQMCVVEEISSEGRTKLQNLLPARVHLVPSYLPLDF